ncbi:MAG TPA: hypothetical protein VI259_19105 [Gemmatimonadaceae bacterium]
MSDASKALEQSSQPGKRMVESSPTGCIWSPDPKIKIERVAGLGDEAFYQIYPKDSPFIWVRKGTNAISIRIMGTKANRFSLEQEKAKELTLAKAAIAKL